MVGYFARWSSILMALLDKKKRLAKNTKMLIIIKS